MRWNIVAEMVRGEETVATSLRSWFGQSPRTGLHEQSAAPFWLDRVKQPFAGRDGNAQSILRRRHRATILRVVNAVRMVGEVEIEREDACAILRQVDVATAAVGGTT